MALEKQEPEREPVHAEGTARHKLPQDTRLRRRKEFDEVFSRGKRVAGASFACHLLPGVGEDSRLGLAVSRKVGNAVVRNRVKRCIREFYRVERDQLMPGLQLVVVARPPSATLSCAEIAGELSRLLRRGKAYDG